MPRLPLPQLITMVGRRLSPSSLSTGATPVKPPRVWGARFSRRVALRGLPVPVVLTSPNLPYSTRNLSSLLCRRCVFPLTLVRARAHIERARAAWWFRLCRPRDSAQQPGAVAPPGRLVSLCQFECLVAAELMSPFRGSTGAPQAASGSADAAATDDCNRRRS